MLNSTINSTPISKLNPLTPPTVNRKVNSKINPKVVKEGELLRTLLFERVLDTNSCSNDWIWLIQMILIERKVAQKTWVIHTNSETHKRRIRRKRNLINKLFDWRSSRTNETNGIPLMSLRWTFPDHYPLTPWEDQNTALHGLFRSWISGHCSGENLLKESEESEESDGHQSAGYDSHRMIDQKSSDFRDFIICFAKNRNCFCTLKFFG